MSQTPGPDAGWQPYAGSAPVYPPPAGPPRSLSVTSMVLALSSILATLILPIIGVPLAISGLVLGIVAARREPYAKPFWLTGIIAGGTVAMLSIVGGIVLIAMVIAYSGY